MTRPIAFGPAVACPSYFAGEMIDRAGLNQFERAMPSARALVLRTEPASSLGHSASVAIAGETK